MPVVQGLLVRLPGRRRHGDLQGRGAVPAVPAPAAAAGALRPRLAAALGAARGQRAAARQRWRCAIRRVARAWPSGPAASTRAARCRSSRDRPSASGSPTTTGAQRLAGAAVGGHVHRPLHARRSARRRCGCCEAAGYDVQVTDKPVCCGLTWISTGQLDGARSAAAAHASTRSTRPSGSASRSSGWSRRAPRCCATTCSSCCPTTRARRRSPARRGRSPSCSPPRRAGRRPTSPASRAVAQPHCHQHAVLGWEADAELLAERRRGGDAVGGCCGLAGNFGVERGHYEVSVAVAETALLPAVRAAAARRGRARRRVLLPHPARAARPGARAGTSAQLLDG